jgi:ribosomal protein L11 methyltransferase
MTTNNTPFYSGRQLVIAPPQFDLPIEPRKVPICIDPGSAFGTTHPTTQLCLQAIERHLKPGATMIDLGTGTGILAIAAAKLGAESVVAVDNDADAVRVARENSAANGVAGKTRVQLGSLEQILNGDLGIMQASLVVANILANVIVAFFGQGLAQTVTPGGLLILSGILRAQTPEIRACLQWHGMELLAQERMEEWVCIIAGHE